MNLLRTFVNRYAPGILLLLAGVAAFVFYQVCYPYHFFYQEQNQLFLNSADWLATYFDKPAWLACMMGDWLTQFYYYRYAGPAILAVALLLVGLMVYRGVQMAIGKNEYVGQKERLVACCVALTAMVVEALFSLDYGYRLCSVLALAGGAASYMTYRWAMMVVGFLFTHHSLKTRTTSSVSTRCFTTVDCFLAAIGLLLSFWFFGYGMMLYVALLLVGCFMQMDRQQILAHIVAIALPLCLIPLTKRYFLLDYEPLFSYPGKGKWVMPQTELEKILAADCEYYFGNYNRVVKQVEADAAPNQYQLFYYNLVMAQRHQLPDCLLRYPSNFLGTFETIGPGTPQLTIMTMPELYWVLGDMTFAERAAMLASVSSPHSRNIRMTKCLAEINIVKGDYAAARKYLRILQKTWVWKQWATTLLSALDEKQDVTPPALKTYMEKANFTNRTDTLRLGDNAYVIMHELLESNSENRIALDYLLCSDLLLKDMDTFKRDYDSFCYKMENPPCDVKLYQEALMIYLAGTNAPQSEWQKYINRPDIVQRFAEYNRQRGSDAFKDTYWYYFDRGTAPKLK